MRRVSLPAWHVMTKDPSHVSSWLHSPTHSFPRIGTARLSSMYTSGLIETPFIIEHGTEVPYQMQYVVCQYVVARHRYTVADPQHDTAFIQPSFPSSKNSTCTLYCTSIPPSVFLSPAEVSGGTFFPPGTLGLSVEDVARLKNLLNVFLSHFLCSSGEASMNSFACFVNRSTSEASS